VQWNEDVKFNFFPFQNCGVKASFKFLQYMEIVKRDIAAQDLFVSDSRESDVKTYDDSKINDLYKQIFVTGEFESKPLFIQAFTHHSCYSDNSCECNQKLAFLGNALLGK